MKNSLVFGLSIFLLLAPLLQRTSAGSTSIQQSPSGEARLSPENWPPGELEKYSQLQQRYSPTPPGAESSQGMVAVTNDAMATRVGLEALQQGGSAVDAALAAALAQIVLKGGATVSYAGMMTMVYYDAASKKVYSLNAGYNTVQEEREPKSIPGVDKASGRTALVPGFFAGVQAAHDRFGKLPFARLFDSAVYLAEKGFIVDPLLGYFLKTQKGVLTRLPETKRVFTKENGELYQTGDLFKQPQLAETLRKVAVQGSGYIYQGDWAKRFVAAVRSEGGKMTLADLKAYRPLWADPVQTGYHGYQVYGLGHPSLGGVTTVEALNLLEVADLKRYGHYTTSPEALYWFIQICRGLFLSFQPETVKKHIPQLDLTPESRVKKETARLIWQKMNEPVWREVFAPEKPKNEESRHSAGVVTVDAQGNVAALLHSINTPCTTSCWGGTGIFVDGISIPDSASFQQVRIASIKPGDRLPEHTYPLIVLKNDKPYLASSSVGSWGVHPVTMNNLVNVLDFGMNPKTSIATPNFMGPLNGAPWDRELLPDGAVAQNVIDAVIAKGQPIKLLSKQEAYTQAGFWVAIQIDPKTGKRIGAGPPGLNANVAGY